MNSELPNLTLDNCGGSISAGCETYAGQKELCEKRNIPAAVVKLAKKRMTPDERKKYGIQQSGIIKWTLLQPYLQANYAELTTFIRNKELIGSDEERDRLELRKLKAETIKLENYNRSKSDEYIKRSIVIESIKTLLSNHIAKLRRWLEQEQPAKCDGMSALQMKAANKELVDQMINDLRVPLITWQNGTDSNAEPESETATDGSKPE